jgi:hypothetical protein
MVYSGAWGKLLHEKNQKSKKSRGTVSLNHLQLQMPGRMRVFTLLKTAKSRILNIHHSNHRKNARVERTLVNVRSRGSQRDVVYLGLPIALRM